MSTIDDGGPAAPVYEHQYIHEIDQRVPTLVHAGMTVRDVFAAAALQGLLAQSMGTALGSDPKIAAEYAYATADAMLKARVAE